MDTRIASLRLGGLTQQPNAKTEDKSTYSGTYKPVYVHLEEEAGVLERIMALKPATSLDSKEANLEQKLITIWQKIALLRAIDTLVKLPYRGHRDCLDNIKFKPVAGETSVSFSGYINNTLIPLRHVLESECGMFLDDETLAALPPVLPLKIALPHYQQAKIAAAATTSAHYKVDVVLEVIQLFDYASKDLYKSLRSKTDAKETELKLFVTDLARCTEFKAVKLDATSIAASDTTKAAEKHVQQLLRHHVNNLSELLDFINFQIGLMNRSNKFIRMFVPQNLVELTHITPKWVADNVIIVENLYRKIVKVLEMSAGNLSHFAKLDDKEGTKQLASAREQAKTLYASVIEFNRQLQEIATELKKVGFDSSLHDLQSIVLDCDGRLDKLRMAFAYQSKQKRAELEAQVDSVNMELTQLKAMVSCAGPKVKTAFASGKFKSIAPQLPLLAAWNKAYNQHILPAKVQDYARVCHAELKSDPLILQDVVTSLCSFIVYQAGSDITHRVSLTAVTVMLMSEMTPAQVKPTLLAAPQAISLVSGYLFAADEVHENNLIEALANFICHRVDTAKQYAGAFSTAELETTTVFLQFVIDACFNLGAVVPSALTLPPCAGYVNMARNALLWGIKFNKPTKTDLPHLFVMAEKTAEDCKELIEKEGIDIGKAYVPQFFSDAPLANKYKTLDALIKQLGQLINQIAGFNYTGIFSRLVEIATPIKQYRNNCRHTNFADIDALKKCLTLIANGSIKEELTKANAGMTKSRPTV